MPSEIHRRKTAPLCRRRITPRAVFLHGMAKDGNTAAAMYTVIWPIQTVMKDIIRPAYRRLIALIS